MYAFFPPRSLPGAQVLTHCVVFFPSLPSYMGIFHEAFAVQE